MATVGQKYQTIADLLKSQNPDGSQAQVIEMLSESNEMLQDLVAIEANNTTGHRHTIRTGLPQGTWRRLYGGVQPSKSTKAQVDDAIGMLEVYSVADKALVDKAPNPAAFRESEAVSFLEGMGQQFADTLIYGNTDVHPERFMGLAPRYSEYGDGSDPTHISHNVIDGGGIGNDNTSIWFVTWGERSTAGIYPKGSTTGGIDRKDQGQVTQQEADGSKWEAYQEHFCHKIGLAVMDWRDNVRIANIDVSDMKAGNVELEMLMIDAYGRLKKPMPFDANRIEGTYIYCNAAVWTALNKRALQRNSSALTIEQWNGKAQLAFWGIPIKRMDAILNAESAVPAKA